TVDMQHGLIDYQVALELIRTIQGRGRRVLVRLPWLDDPLAMKMLDAGADGLICPMISSRAQTEQFVAACSYPPAGIRSFGPTRAVLHDPEYLSVGAAEITKIVQIEERIAVEAVEEIVSTPGLDM